MTNKKDPYMSKDDVKIEKRANEEYKEQVADFLESISTARVHKRDLTTEVEGVVFPKFEWVVKIDKTQEGMGFEEYKIDSEFHRIFSVEAYDIEVSRLSLKKRDYDKIIKACEARDAVLKKEHQIKK